jgi:hypothetical protein
VVVNRCQAMGSLWQQRPGPTLSIVSCSFWSSLSCLLSGNNPCGWVSVVASGVGCKDGGDGGAVRDRRDYGQPVRRDLRRLRHRLQGAMMMMMMMIVMMMGMQHGDERGCLCSSHVLCFVMATSTVLMRDDSDPVHQVEM